MAQFAIQVAGGLLGDESGLEYVSEESDDRRSSHSSAKRPSKKNDHSIPESWFWKVVDSGALSLQSNLNEVAKSSGVVSLKKSAEAAICILLLAKSVKENKANFHALALDVASIVVQVHASYEKATDKLIWSGKVLQDNLTVLMRILDEIKEFIKHRVEGKGTFRLFTKDQDRKKIKEYQQKLADAARPFLGNALNFENYVQNLTTKPANGNTSETPASVQKEEGNAALILLEESGRKKHEVDEREEAEKLEQIRLSESQMREQLEKERRLREEINQLDEEAEKRKREEAAEYEQTLIAKRKEELKATEAQAKRREIELQQKIEEQEQELARYRRKVEQERQKLQDEISVNKLKAKEAEYFAQNRVEEESSGDEGRGENETHPPTSSEEESEEEEDSEAERLRQEEERRAMEKEARRAARAARRAAREEEDRLAAEEEARKERKKKKKSQTVDQGFAGPAYQGQAPYPPPPPPGYYYPPPHPTSPYAPSPYFGSPAYPGSPMPPPGSGWVSPPVSAPKGSSVVMNSGNVFNSVVSNVGNNYSRTGGTRKKAKTQF